MPGHGELRRLEQSGHKLSDVKPYPKVVEKKMVQARLPFAPKVKGSISQRKIMNTGERGPSAYTESSLDDDANGTKMEPGKVQSVPKIINGQGPLDNYVRKMSKPCNVIPVVVDLIKESNDKLSLSKESVMESKSNIPSPPRKLLFADQHFGDESCLKQTVVCFAEDPTEISKAASISTELQTVGSASFFTSPVANTKDADTSVSSSSSSSSSPDSPSTVLKKTIESSSPLDSCKEKLHLKRPKLQAQKEQRDRVKEELKLAKDKAKEEAKKRKDEERELKAKEKKEKKEKDDKEKAEKLRLKEEKKKEKLEALEAKQEEKRKKEKEKQLKEEEKRMKAEKAEITRFLQKSKNSHTPKILAQSCGKFAPFEIKKNMAVAPLCRVDFDTENSDQLGKLMEEQNSNVSFLLELKTRKPRKMGRTVIPNIHFISDKDDVEVLIESDAALHEDFNKCVLPKRREFGKMKLLQFSENYRPAYWGTWNRSSTFICPRRPWAQDTILDYEVDSDEEWEEEEPGESLSHSEGEDEEDQKEEDEDDDDGFFVPHGYLSEDEGGVSDEECNDPENQKVRQRLKAKEWDELQSKGKKISILKPVLIGCVWFGCISAEISFLQKFSTCVLDTIIPIEEEMAQECNSSRRLEDREILAHLLPLLHGNVNGSKTIIHEFQECCRRGIISLCDCSNIAVTESTSPNVSYQTPTSNNIPSKARLKRIISEHSVYEKRPDHRSCWYVHNDILKSFQLESLPVPCQWTYFTQVNVPGKDELLCTGAQIQATPSSKRKSAGSMPITKFMKKATAIGQVTNMVTETDCFQADTEDDDDEDNDDCFIVEEELKRDTEVSVLCVMDAGISEQQAISKLETSIGSN